MASCLHCGATEQTGRYCTQCGWPRVQKCPVCSREIALIDHPSRCPGCQTVLKPCPERGCGRAIRPEEAVCPCRNQRPADPVVRPWLDLRGDGAGQRNVLWTQAPGDPIDGRPRVTSQGLLVWAGVCQGQWSLVTSQFVATEQGLKLAVPGGVAHAVASADKTIYLRTPTGVLRFDGKSLSTVLEGSWTWIRTWGSTLVAAKDSEVRFVPTDGSAPWTVDAPGAISILWESPSEAVIVCPDRFLVVERGEQTPRVLPGGGSGFTVLWHSRLFTPADGSVNVRNLGDGMAHNLPALEGLKRQSTIAVYGTPNHPRVAYLTQHEIRSADGMTSPQTLAPTYQLPVEGWALAYRDGDQPMAVLARSRHEGYGVFLQTDLPREVAENAQGQIWIGFCEKGFFIVRHTAGGLELVVSE